MNWSPRAGVAVAVLPQRSAIVRGGFGKFVQRTPLNVGAFPSFEPRTITRDDGGPAIPRAHSAHEQYRRPAADARGAGRQPRVGSTVRPPCLPEGRGPAAYGRARVHRVAGSWRPAVAAVEHRPLAAIEKSKRRPAMRSERRDLTVSYVWARGTADLNNYDQFYGNLRNPIVRANEYNLIPTDVRHRLLLRGTIGLPGQLGSSHRSSSCDRAFRGRRWTNSRTSGPRSRAGRLPAVRTLDLAASRVRGGSRKYRFRAGVRAYNVFGAAAPTRHPDQHDLALLRHGLQPGRSIDRLGAGFPVAPGRAQPRELAGARRRAGSLPPSAASPWLVSLAPLLPSRSHKGRGPP